MLQLVVERAGRRRLDTRPDAGVTGDPSEFLQLLIARDEREEPIAPGEVQPVQITALGSEIERATQATQVLAWKTSLRWVLGIAIAIPLTVAVCVTAFSPHDSLPEEQGTAGKAVIPNIALTSAQTPEAVAKLSLCQFW